MNLSGRDKIILTVIAALLAVICYVEIFLMPMTDKISQANSDIRDINVKLDKITVTDEKYNSNKKIKTDLDAKVLTASDSLPGIAKEPEITHDLTNEASKAGVSITAVSFSTAADFDSVTITKPGETVKSVKFKIPKGKLMSLPASIAVNGTYNAILNFINNIEKDKRIAEAQDVNIAISQNSSNLDATISVNYYYLDSTINHNFNYDFVGDASQYGKSDMFGK